MERFSLNGLNANAATEVFERVRVSYCSLLQSPQVQALPDGHDHTCCYPHGSGTGRVAIKLLYVSLLLLTIIVPSYAANLEVGPGKSFSSIQAAVNGAQPGDTVLVYPAVYNEQVATVRAGANGNYIVIKAAGPGVVLDPQGGGDGFLINRHSYIAIEGFTIQGASRTNAWGGAINCQSSHYLILRNNVIIDTLGGTGGGSNPQTGVGDLNIENCDNLLMENNRALSRNADYNLGTWWSENMVIRGNEFAGALRYPVKLSALSQNVLFERNYVHTDRTGTNNGQHFNFFFRDSSGGTVRHNVFDARGSDAFSAGELYDYSCDDREDHEVYNNVFIHDRGGRSAVRWTCQEGTYFRNNIVVSTWAAHEFVFDPSDVTIDYDVHSAPTEYSNGVGATIRGGASNRRGSPDFVGTGTLPSPYFRLQAGSPAIDGGDPVTPRGVDYDGLAVPKGVCVDIGAFEYGDAVPPASPIRLRLGGP